MNYRFRLRSDELVSESDSHRGDQRAEECLEFSDTVLLQEQEGKGVADCDQDTGP